VTKPNYTEAFKEGLSFIRRAWIGRTEEWIGALEDFYPALGRANFSNRHLESYLRAAARGEAHLPSGLKVIENQGRLTIRVTKEG